MNYKNRYFFRETYQTEIRLTNRVIVNPYTIAKPPMDDST